MLLSKELRSVTTDERILGITRPQEKDSNKDTSDNDPGLLGSVLPTIVHRLCDGLGWIVSIENSLDKRNSTTWQDKNDKQNNNKREEREEKSRAETSRVERERCANGGSAFREQPVLYHGQKTPKRCASPPSSDVSSTVTLSSTKTCATLTVTIKTPQTVDGPVHTRPLGLVIFYSYMHIVKTLSVTGRKTDNTHLIRLQFYN